MERSSITRPLFPILLGVSVMVFFIFLTDVFDDVVADVGFQFYAEPADHEIPLLPSTLKMPMNSLVNVGYVIAGVYWIIRASDSSFVRTVHHDDNIVYDFLYFAWMSIVYGVVQFLRITYQSHTFAILDQWCTFPFFCWILPWTNTVSKSGTSEELGLKHVALPVLSVCSFFLVLVVVPRGFEVDLLIHIVAAVVSGVRLQLREGNEASLKNLIKTLLCCAGFVLLKLYDHELASVSTMFHRFSGHFWSKICDVMQIHYTCSFMYEVSCEHCNNNGEKQSRKKKVSNQHITFKEKV